MFPLCLRFSGPDGKDLVTSEDPVADKNNAMEFAARGREKIYAHRAFRVAPTSRSETTISHFRFRLLIEKESGTSTPRLDVRRSCSGVLARTNWTLFGSAAASLRRSMSTPLTKHGDSIMTQYAQRIISTPGKQDGLAWQNADGSWDGPIW